MRAKRIMGEGFVVSLLDSQAAIPDFNIHEQGQSTFQFRLTQQPEISSTEGLDNYYQI
jgi:hypothetical protein